MSNRTVTQLGAIVLMAPLIVPLSAQNQMVKGNTCADTVEVGVRTLTLIGAGLRERGWLDEFRIPSHRDACAGESSARVIGGFENYSKEIDSCVGGIPTVEIEPSRLRFIALFSHALQ